MSPVAAGAPVLVVEDEPLIRMLAVDIASEHGFQVFEVANADEAVSILEANEMIGFVFTDIDMPPGRDGLALANIVNARWPSIQLVITSGKMRPPPDLMPPGSVFLPKPYSPADLASAFAWPGCG